MRRKLLRFQSLGIASGDRQIEYLHIRDGRKPIQENAWSETGGRLGRLRRLSGRGSSYLRKHAAASCPAACAGGGQAAGGKACRGEAESEQKDHSQVKLPLFCSRRDLANLARPKRQCFDLLRRQPVARQSCGPSLRDSIQNLVDCFLSRGSGNP